MADLEEELDRLYGLPLDGFTAARNELSRRLKSDGRADDSAAVKELKKPSVSAGVLNQLARREPELVQRLLAAGDGVRQAQEHALAGGAAEELRRASSAELDAIQALVRAARGLGGAPVSQAVLDRVQQNLRAAAADADARALIERGRVSADFEQTGFPAVADVPQDELAVRRRKRDDRAEVLRRLRGRLSQLRRDETRALQESRRAEERAAQAREAASRAEQGRVEAVRAAAELSGEIERVEAELAEAEAD